MRRLVAHITETGILSVKELVYRHETTLRNIALVLSIILWLALLIATFGAVLIYIAIIALFAVIAHSGLIAHLRGNGIRITPTQMPDLYERMATCTRTLQMAMPDAYLVNGNGVLNAFATRFLGRNFVVLLSDVVDSMDDRPDALNFYIGHELGHIRQHHLTWAKVLAPAMFLPLIGAAYSRAREYTCDRHGLAVCANPEDAQYGLAALAAGKRRWRSVDLAEFSASAAFRPGFWMSLHELVGDYPWLNKRQAWLRAIAEGRKPKLGGRNAFAYVFALWLPRIPGLGVAGGMIVIAYIAIAAAVAIPAYQDYLHRANVAAAITDAAPYQSAVAQYAMKNRVWPESIDQVGLPSFAGDKSVSTIQLGPKGELNVSLAGSLHGHILQLSPYLSQGQIHWACGGDVPTKALPLTCTKD